MIALMATQTMGYYSIQHTTSAIHCSHDYVIGATTPRMETMLPALLGALKKV
jgi:hypothetical protein